MNIRETKRQLSDRFGEHRRLIEKVINPVTFIILPPFQTTSPFQIIPSRTVELIPSELINSDRNEIRKAREGFLISKGKTLEPYGMNRRDEI